jgi:DNA invertase Pin-like site-specific DNA recombinase
MGLVCDTAFREAAMSARQRRAGLPMRALLLTRLNRTRPTILVADVSVLGRSLPDLVAVLAEVESRRATVLVADDVGDARPVAAADLEAARRAYIREAVMEGRAKARARGVEFGRPRVVAAKVQVVRAALAKGMGVRAAARAGGVGVATATRIRDCAARSDLSSGPATGVSWPHHPPS